MRRFLSRAPGRLADAGHLARIFVAVLPAAIIVMSFGASSASASTAQAIVQSGGMVWASSRVASSSVPASTPSCHSVTYRGNAGYVSVQERSNRLQWGITMTPLKYSVGRWNVSTYLSGKKTSSGFNRTVTSPYIPHGSLTVPSGKIFHVQAKVVGKYGTFVSVPNACRT
jgi:hypothetical protein